MDDDLLPPVNPPDPAPVPSVRGKNIQCEFCECTLAPSGDYIRLSERAKELRKLDEKIVDLKATIEAKDREIAELHRQLAAAKPEPQAKRSFWRQEVGSDG